MVFLSIKLAKPYLMVRLPSSDLIREKDSIWKAFAVVWFLKPE
jgi:hypothetical protein